MQNRSCDEMREEGRRRGGLLLPSLTSLGRWTAAGGKAQAQIGSRSDGVKGGRCEAQSSCNRNDVSGGRSITPISSDFIPRTHKLQKAQVKSC